MVKLVFVTAIDSTSPVSTSPFSTSLFTVVIDLASYSLKSSASVLSLMSILKIELKRKSSPLNLTLYHLRLTIASKSSTSHPKQFHLLEFNF